jgi:hypothetical protein
LAGFHKISTNQYFFLSKTQAPGLRTNLPVTGIEYPLKDGQSIVSRIDTKGRITQVNPTPIDRQRPQHRAPPGHAAGSVRRPVANAAGGRSVDRTCEKSPQERRFLLGRGQRRAHQGRGGDGGL